MIRVLEHDVLCLEISTFLIYICTCIVDIWYVYIIGDNIWYVYVIGDIWYMYML